MLGSSTGKPAKHLLGFGGAEAQNCSVLDVLDQFAADRASEYTLQLRVFGSPIPGALIGVIRPTGLVEAYTADVLQARKEPEAEQVCKGEANDRSYVDTFGSRRL